MLLEQLKDIGKKETVMFLNINFNSFAPVAQLDDETGKKEYVQTIHSLQEGVCQKTKGILSQSEGAQAQEHQSLKNWLLEVRILLGAPIYTRLAQWSCESKNENRVRS